MRTTVIARVAGRYRSLAIAEIYPASSAHGFWPRSSYEPLQEAFSQSADRKALSGELVLASVYYRDHPPEDPIAAGTHETDPAIHFPFIAHCLYTAIVNEIVSVFPRISIRLLIPDLGINQGFKPSDGGRTQGHLILDITDLSKIAHCFFAVRPDGAGFIDLMVPLGVYDYRESRTAHGSSPWGQVQDGQQLDGDALDGERSF